MIVRDNWRRRNIFGRLVHWNLVHYMFFHWMLIRRVHTVVHWGLIDMNRLPMVGRNWRGSGGGDERWSRGDQEGGECARGGESRSWMGGGGGKVVRHGCCDVVEVVVVNWGRQRLHLLIGRLVCWLWWYIRSRRVVMFIRRWRIIRGWRFIRCRRFMMDRRFILLVVNWWRILLMMSWGLILFIMDRWLIIVISNWGFIRGWGLI